MSLTSRGFLLLLGGALPLAAASFWPTALYLAAAYFLIALGLLAADVLLSPQPRQLTVARRHDRTLSLGAENTIHVVVQNRADRPVKMSVRDEFPAGFHPDRWVTSGTAPARGELEVTYHLKPARRGDYRFGDLNLRYEGALGFIVRQERYQAAAGVKVYPNLLEAKRYELLARRGRLREIGLRNARLLGRGTEFERLREYQTDDDFRRINWKATARRGHPVSVDYQTERSQTVMVMLDTGRLMASPIGPLGKIDHAVNTALMLAYVALRYGDEVGLIAFADRIAAHLAPRRGKRQFLALLDTLYRLPAIYTEPDFDLAFRHLAMHQRKRSLVVLFTDLIDPESSRLLVSHLAALSPRHLTACVAISDPQVSGLASATPSNSRALYQRAVAEQLLDERRLALEELRRRGAIALDVPADQLTAAVVSQYLELKARTRL